MTALTFISAVRTLATSRTALIGAAALGALALANIIVARRAERRHPPQGRFIEVDGVRLHYTDQGTGAPVVLVHGNAVTGGDWSTSGVADLLLQQGHRVVVFDRPGFGHSERPRGPAWTAGQQADLLHHAVQRLGIKRPVVAGHSWGAIVALAMAAQHPENIAGVVAVSGYYFWTLRPDILLVTPGALPGIGDLLRYTVSPPLGRLLMPLLKRGMFSPQPVPERFRAEYSDAMALRPSQIRATSVDGALMIPSALSLRHAYEDLALPVFIIAGASDKVVFAKSARRLHAHIPGSSLSIVEDAGHMVHYHVPQQVAVAVRQVGEASREQRSLPHLARELAPTA